MSHERDEEALVSSAGELPFDVLFEQLGVGIAILAADGRVVRANGRLAAMLGRSPERLCRSTLLEFAAAEDPARVAAGLQQLARGSSPELAIELRCVREDGTAGWCRARISSCGSTASCLLAVVEDVTESKRADERERASEQRLAAIVESSDDAIATKDLDGIVRTWNKGAERIFGYTADEMVGSPITRIIPPDRLEEERTILERLRRGERIDHYETVRIAKDGRAIDVSLTVSPIRDSTGAIVGASKVSRDISARRRADAALRRREEELHALADSIPQLAWIADAGGNVFWFNRRWYQYTGAAPEQSEGWNWAAAHDPEVLPRVLERWTESLRTGEDFEMEFPLRGADGTYRWFLTRSTPVRDAGGRVTRWFGTATDVDEVKRAREALADQTRVLELLNETGRTIAADLELQPLLQKVTDSATEVSGAEFGAFFCHAHDEHGAPYVRYTWSGPRREAFERIGHPRTVPLFAPTFEGRGAIRSHDVLSDEHYGAWTDPPDGRAPVRSYLAVPVVSRSGEVVGGLFFGHSRPGVFTKRIEQVVSGIAAQAAIAIDNARLYESVKLAAEERRQLLEAERSARSEAERVSFMKDEFLATLSHELRTPLNAIVGWSQVLKMRDNTPEPELREGLSVIERNAKVQAKLIEDLLDMSRIVSGKVRLEVQRVDLADVVSAAIASVRPSADAKSQRLAVRLDPRAGAVWGDPSRLQQCFWNLLSNAIKFSDKGGAIRVSVARLDGQVDFTVADEGRGISPEFLPHVFDRFRQADASTTRRHGGLGLGLSIVKSLVELHGGSVRAASAGEGKGATFTIELPAAAEERAMSDRIPRGGLDGHQRDLPKLDGITVLAVDDEADARNLVQRVLEDCGARVLLAESARAGLEILRRERPDVLISDIGMPDEDGYKLIRDVRRLDPNHGGRTPAAALSAFARPEDRTRSLRAGYQTHVAKPVEAMELTAVVASLAMKEGD